ncbi:hypothetical protein L210DRAFT_3545668 [Boletus edulis BED1]|uniref:Uncharacterized protein n=1 Tax=Boletus edulis BED1 TaxID=1328754 RepID=A0AAD4BS43_BOLED|nr:hypothetical protein L210DRAFT_3545668 [Boletus edulis BED1]
MSTTFNVQTFLGQNGYGLNTLDLSVRFHGALYFRDAPEQVPVHVSIRLSDEWATVLPSVQDVSKEKLTAKKPLTLAMFPFLPLPSFFDPTDTCQWQQLTKQIEHCLVVDPLLDSKNPECYRFMRELFWMAFIAAYPDFPRGKWLRWNALIPMEGDFISHWTLKDEDTELPDIPIHVIIWEQFQSIISDTLSIHCVQ